MWLEGLQSEVPFSSRTEGVCWQRDTLWVLTVITWPRSCVSGVPMSSHFRSISSSLAGSHYAQPTREGWQVCPHLLGQPTRRPLLHRPGLLLGAVGSGHVA